MRCSVEQRIESLRLRQVAAKVRAEGPRRFSERDVQKRKAALKHFDAHGT
jgi:hypothetical protein